MSAYINVTTRDDTAEVTFYAAGDVVENAALVVRIGTAGIHLDPDAARELAEDILAALPAVTA